MIPKPDLSHIEKEMDVAMNQLWRAFPHARYGSNRDHFAYKRVSPHIQTFKSLVTTELKQLSSSQNWTAALDFLVVAARKVNNLPSWDDSNDNKSRNDLWSQIGKIFVETSKNIGDGISYEHWEIAHQE
jgi:hypothetical protein